MNISSSINIYYQFIMSSSVNIGLVVGMSVLFFIVGAIFSWFVSMKIFKKQLKANPPINEDQIRDLYKQLGRKASEKQIQQIMNRFKK